MYKLTILSDRQHFYELNKIYFIIFGHLRELILINKDLLRNGIIKLFLISKKKENQFDSVAHSEAANDGEARAYWRVLHKCPRSIC
jgi:hypothetical protein